MHPKIPDEERLAIVKQICGLIIQDSVESACKQVGIAESTFYAWIAADTDLAGHYARAREIVAFSDEWKVEKVVRDVENGRIDPAAARTAIDGRKWLAGRRNPKVYGERSFVETKNENLNKNTNISATDYTDEQLEAVAALLKK